MKELKADAVIVGCGVAGLYCALNMPLHKDIIIITKSKAQECDSYLAQGGICMLPCPEDYSAFYQDTMRAGHFENNPQSVDIMIQGSQEVIKDVIGYGARFEHDKDGSLKFTREGAHSRPRILFHEDITGKEITSHLLKAVRRMPNIRLYEDTAMLDILTGTGSDGKQHCTGIVATCPKRSPLAKYRSADALDGNALVCIKAENVVWACGGIGGLYAQSTNFPHLTGDALGIALHHHIPLQNPDYIQIHPTTLYTGRKERAFLISESVRGEGGILLDKNKKRFTDELQPRDVVANAIFTQMKKDGTKHVWLSMEHIDEKDIRTHFRHIYEQCLKEGYDCTKEPIPVVPAQHYFMGGVDVDSWSRTSLEGLYAVGETSCNGVHGKNRLASNSLLESLVFAKRAAAHMQTVSVPCIVQSPANMEKYKDTQRLFAQYQSTTLAEIERMRLYHEQHIA